MPARTALLAPSHTAFPFLPNAGKKCNPHLVRDSIVTYLRGGGATERELEALAIYMVRALGYAGGLGRAWPLCGVLLL